MEDKMEIEEEPSNNNQPVKIGKETFVSVGNRALRDCYEFTKNLGKGGYGKVFQVRQKMTNKLFACKKLSKLNQQFNQIPKRNRYFNKNRSS